MSKQIVLFFMTLIKYKKKKNMSGWISMSCSILLKWLKTWKTSSKKTSFQYQLEEYPQSLCTGSHLIKSGNLIKQTLVRRSRVQKYATEMKEKQQRDNSRQQQCLKHRNTTYHNNILNCTVLHSQYGYDYRVKLTR